LRYNVPHAKWLIVVIVVVVIIIILPPLPLFEMSESASAISDIQI
jgi:hypothetical protein